MQNIDINSITFIVGVLVANMGVIFGFFISLKVDNATNRVKVDRLEQDVKALGDLYRETQKNLKESQ